MSENKIKAYWHVCDNFGDMLTPYLIKKITNIDPDFTSLKAKTEADPFIVVGSILGCSVKRGIVWGAGCAFESDLNPECFSPPSKNFNIIATRGKLSKALVEQAGHKPIAYGDPGLLLPRFYTPKVVPENNIGIICSWVDYDDVLVAYGSEMPVINSLTTSVEDTIDMIYKCKTIISSCLHGLVVAAAYGIPTVWVEFSDRMMGDGFKFRDFFSSIEQDAYVPIDLKNKLDYNELIKLPFRHTFNINLQQLYDCCPFKDIRAEDKDINVAEPEQT